MVRLKPKDKLSDSPPFLQWPRPVSEREGGVNSWFIKQGYSAAWIIVNLGGVWLALDCYSQIRVWILAYRQLSVVLCVEF